jgi:hypothetical protein
MTRDELEKLNIDLMGENLGKQYTALFHEVAALHLYWSILERIYRAVRH